MTTLPKERKIAIVGATAVGKSSTSLQFNNNEFNESYYPTVENQFSKEFKYKGNTFSIETLDTAGQDEFSLITSKLSIGIHGYILMYSITSRQSFDLLAIIRDKLLDSAGIGGAELEMELEKPMIIVGNKTDLEIHRQVSIDEAKKLSENWFGPGKSIPYLECSAKLDHNVRQAFEIMLDEIEKFEGGDSNSDDEINQNGKNGNDKASSNKTACVIM